MTLEKVCVYNNSDVDLLIEFSKTPSLLKHVALEYEMSEGVFSSKKVDLVTKRSLNEYMLNKEKTIKK